MMSRLVPKLRFREFSGEWEEKTLEKVSVFINEKIKLIYIDLNNYISTENLLPDFMGVSKSSKLPNILNVTKFQENDVLMSNIRPYLKKIWLADISGGASNDIIVTRAKEGNDYKILLYMMQDDRFINYVMTGAKGVKMPRGDISLIKKYPLSLPQTLPEQQKIAACLSSLDALIEATSKKGEALKKHKKGLMQQLFPSEGEKEPKLRFDGFSGEWEEKTLGEIVNIFKGKGISKNDITENAKYECIRYGELYTGYREIIKDIKSKTNLQLNDLILSENHDVIIPSSGETYIDIATAHCVVKNNIALGGDLNILRGKENGIFLAYYLSNAKKYDIAKLAQGITVVHLYASQLVKLRLQLPGLREQQKIASCLSSLDSLIEVNQKKIEALKKHKKGLMQGLFVNKEEN